MLWQQNRCRRQNKFIYKKKEDGEFISRRNFFLNSQMLKSLHNKMRVLL
jgi:hypothetical protein